MVWIALSSGVSSAHVPHDTVVGWVPSPDLGGEQPWWVLLNAHTPMLLRSDDGGAIFDSVGGLPMGDRPGAMARTDAGVLVLLGATEYWWSDDGSSWDHQPLPAELTLLVASGDDVLLAGAGGLWRVSPGAGPVQELSEEVSTLSGGLAPVAVLAGGELAAWAESWTALTTPEAEVRVAYSDGTTTYAGSASGRAWRFEAGEWAGCGPLPSQDVEHGDVVAFHASDGLVHTADGFSALFRSDDACATWTELPVPDGTIYGVEGGAEDEGEAVVTLVGAGDGVGFGGWPGLWYSQDGGATWENPALMALDYVRGLAIEPNPAGVPRVVVGPQGAGPRVSDDGGVSWSAENHGLPKENVQQLAIDPANRDQLYAVVNHLGYASENGGKSWTLVEPDQGRVSVFRTGPSDCEVWAATPGAIVRSEDCGQHWAPVPLGEMPATLEDLRQVTVSGAEEWCFSVRDPAGVWCGPGREGPFELRWAGGDGETPVIAAWPESDPTVVLVASGSSVWRSEDGMRTSSATLMLGLDEAVAIAVADDGTSFLATLVGTVYRSGDGGLTWESLPGMASAPIWAVAARPRMAEFAQLLIGTLDGVYMVDDATGADPTWSPFSPWERADDRSGYWSTDACAASSADSRAAMDTLSALVVPCHRSVSLRGSQLRVIGTATGAALADWFVDGVHVGTIGAAAVVDPGELATVAVADGWHRVDIYALGDEGLMLDALESSGEGAIFSGGEVVVDTGDTGNDADTGDTADTAAQAETASPDSALPEDTAPGDTGEAPPSCGGCSSGGDWMAGALTALSAIAAAARRPRG